MDPQLAALAVAAAQELVTVMVGDGWARVRDAVAGWFGRGDADRERRQAEQLEQTRAAVRDGLIEPAAAAGRWQGRLEALLDDHPELADSLVELVEQVRAASAGVSAGERAFAVSGDVHITAFDSAVAAGVINGGVSTGPPPAPGPARG